MLGGGGGDGGLGMMRYSGIGNGVALGGEASGEGDGEGSSTTAEESSNSSKSSTSWWRAGGGFRPNQGTSLAVNSSQCEVRESRNVPQKDDVGWVSCD